jgi:hypothetical protein
MPMKLVCPSLEISTAPIYTPDTTRSLW